MSDSAPTTDVVLEVDGLCKDFGSHRAVADVCFTVRPGRSLAIVGESGSGKTTVARMIVGLERPTSGTINACGHDRSRAATSTRERRRRAREVQIVFQDPYTSLDPRQTVRGMLAEIVATHAARPDPADASRVDQLLELVGLDRRQAESLPRNLSGGQRQRATIARALAAAPQVMILDESVAALDVSIQAQILNLLMDIRDETGVSYVLISHDLAVVRQLTEDMIVMRHGHVIESGATGDVLDAPTHEYTRLLRDSVPRRGWKPIRKEPS